MPEQDPVAIAVSTGGDMVGENGGYERKGLEC